MKDIDNQKNEAAQYAIEHITGKGMHTGVAWLRDAFNAYCEAMGANEWRPEDISFALDDLAINLQKEPWVAEIARKPEAQLTWQDTMRIVEDFICQHWLMPKEEVTSKHVADVLRVANPLSHRHIVAQKVAIDCIHALDHEQMERLDKVLNALAVNPLMGLSKGRTI